MKKMNNKGFSLVELIIVIAIMAILAGAIAPALIRYIDKSRKSNDVSSGKTIKTAVETAMGNEVAYEELTNNGSGSTIEVTPSGTTSAAVTCSAATQDTKDEIFNNIGEKTPKIKYKKNDAAKFVVTVTSKGTVKVWLAKSTYTLPSNDCDTHGTGCWELAPDLDKEYQ
ncbi:MAG: type II secretion system protein [Lachnospiraceae bacterium]|nr:type II secretion system protein [Lachnospiraceae bacterium]